MSIFTYDDKKVFYLLEGDEQNDVLVILNGIMMSHRSWEPFMAELKRHFRILRVDFLDQGQSDRMDKPYTQALQVDMLEQLLSHLKLKAVNLTGISYGGSIALQYAAAHPGRIRRMVVLNAAARTTPWLRDIGRGWNAVARTRSGEAYYHITIPYIYSPQFYQKHQSWMEARKQKLMPLFSDSDFLDAMTRLTTSAETHDVEAALAFIRVKTLIVAADHDFLTPVVEQEHLAESMPNAQLVIFPGCGHASMYEKPGLFISTLVGFFKERTTDYAI